MRLISALCGAALVALTGPTSALAAEQLKWKPPVLRTSATGVPPQTVAVTDSNADRVRLDPAIDYRVTFPTDRPVNKRVVIQGGRNVVIVGGEISIGTYTRDLPNDTDKLGDQRRALLLRDQTGTIHVEGLLMRGDDIGDGINLQQSEPGATVQLQNVRAENLHRRWSDDPAHPDCLQTWNGPSYLKVFRMTCISSYQGVFLDPVNGGLHGGNGVRPTSFALEKVNVRPWAGQTMGLMYSRKEAWGTWPQTSSLLRGFNPKPGVWVEGSWPGLTLGDDADYVGYGSAGYAYLSPGYVP